MVLSVASFFVRLLCVNDSVWSTGIHVMILLSETNFWRGKSLNFIIFCSVLANIQDVIFAEFFLLPNDMPVFQPPFRDFTTCSCLTTPRSSSRIELRIDFQSPGSEGVIPNLLGSSKKLSILWQILSKHTFGRYVLNYGKNLKYILCVFRCGSLNPCFGCCLGKEGGQRKQPQYGHHLGLSHPHSILSTSYWFVPKNQEDSLKKAVPNKILKNTSKFIWRHKESIFETLKRWYHAGVRDATWKRFPVVILMHIRSSQQPSCIQQEAQLKQIWKSIFKMSTQFATQTIPQNLSPFVVS